MIGVSEAGETSGAEVHGAPVKEPSSFRAFLLCHLLVLTDQEKCSKNSLVQTRNVDLK